MTSVSKASAAGRNYLQHHGRALDQARLAYLYEQGPQSAVVAALQTYANSDGGFGHGLEPDQMGPASTVVATRLAFEIFHECQITMDHALVRQALGYLKSTYDKDRRAWPISHSKANEGPHAPWWSMKGTCGALFWDENPSPEIIAHLLPFRKQSGYDWIDDILTACRFGSDFIPRSANMHSLASWFVLIRSPSIASHIRESLLYAVEPLVQQTVALEPEQWSQYTLRPLDVVGHPDDPLRKLIPEHAIKDNLAFMLKEQAADGGWHPTWNWGDAFPEHWPIAEQHWTSSLTFKAVHTLARWTT